MTQQNLNSICESLVLLNLVELTHVEHQRLKTLISEIQNEKWWEHWLQLVGLNSCESLVYLNIKKHTLIVPDDVMEPLHKTYQKIASENSSRNKEAKAIFSTLHAAQIPFIILKGQALAESFYGSVNYKKMNDVDFIVKKSSLDQLQKIYAEMHLQCAASLGGSDYRKQEKYSHHWPPFFTRTLNCVLGTHWNIITPLSPIKVSEADLWSHAVPHSYLAIECQRLNDLYFFFHLVLHLAYYKTGLKELCDPMNWYRAKKETIDEQAFLKLVSKCNAYDPVYRNLYFLNTVTPDPMLSRWITSLEPNVSSFVIQDTHFRCRELYFLIRSRSTQTSRIEKSYALFSLSDMFYEKLYFLGKMWKHFLFPKKQDVLMMQNLREDASIGQQIVAYLRSPYLLSRVFAFDLGWSLHFMLIAKHHLDLLLSTVRFVLSILTIGQVFPFPKTLSQKIRSLNLPVDSIEQIKTKLE